MDFDSLKAVQSGLGTAAVIVMDDKSTDVVDALGFPISTSTRGVDSARLAVREQGGFG